MEIFEKNLLRLKTNINLSFFKPFLNKEIEMAYGALGNVGRMSNSDISAAVIDRLPSNTFTNVRTFNGKHYFDGAGEVSCRRIELTRTTISCAIEALRCFFMNLFFSEKAKERYGNMASNGDRFLEFVLEGKTGSKEVEQAFICCKTVKIYVSEDCEYADIEFLDSAMLVTANISGQIGKVIIDNAGTIASAAKGGCLVM